MGLELLTGMGGRAPGDGNETVPGSGAAGRPRMSPHHSGISPFPGRRMVLTADLWFVPGDSAVKIQASHIPLMTRNISDYLACRVFRYSIRA
jgi:hypothetical protein